VYYYGMRKPQEAPYSVRLGDERRAKIDAYAEKRRIKRHAAVLEIIDKGLGETRAERAKP
jgi:hypothetical protein